MFVLKVVFLIAGIVVCLSVATIICLSILWSWEGDEN